MNGFGQRIKSLFSNSTKYNNIFIIHVVPTYVVQNIYVHTYLYTRTTYKYNDLGKLQPFQVNMKNSVMF